MTSAFQDKSARVIFVDPSGPVRQMVSDVIRSLGFESVEGRGSIADLIEHLEIDEADWVIVPLMGEETVNAMHLLQVVTATPELKNTRVSFLLEEQEHEVLPTAVELGLFSWHTKPFNKESLTKSFTELIETLEANEWDATRTAAHYLRKFLDTADDKEVRCQLEKSLVNLYPGDVDQLTILARALHIAEKQDEAKSVLAQAKLLASDNAAQIDEIAKELFDTTDLGSTDGAANALGLKTAVVVDSDEAVTTEIEQILKEVGVEEIKIFHDGAAAWEYLKDAEEPDVIVQEWRIPKLSGPYLIQNIRHKGFASVPVIVASSLLKPNDMPLLREMGIAKIVNKPLAKKDFLSNLIWTIQQDRSPSEQQI